MPRVDFHRDLRELQGDLLQLGGMVEKAIIKTLDSHKNLDMALAEEDIR
ncbi:MAG: phosphate transport system regulatory protein PhoU, partial [Dehalococcoidia bacterium]|nr:phosphate transport system regulatory protein PhoU [Dehalococcoidia bacterium]